MGFWIFMLIMCLLIPVTMIAVGKYFLKGGPKKINSISGYRTARSMKNKDTWEFAHKFCGRMFLVCGIILLPLTIAAMAFTYGDSTETVGVTGIVIVVIQIAVMAGSVFPTEAALKKHFDEVGRRR